MMRLVFNAMAVTLMTAVSAVAAPYGVIIAGSGGSAEYEARFRDWGTRLQRALTGPLGFESDRVSRLAEPLAGAPLPAGVTAVSRDAIVQTFEELANVMSADDALFVFIIGHGSYQDKEAKLIMPGPDLTATGLSELLNQIPAKHEVIVNAASSGAAFINVLSSENRIVCSATKSVEERNAPEFMEHFLVAIEDGSADQNRDERISVLEACTQAAALTEAAYTAERLILSEHAILDDNGDGLGTRLPIPGEEATGEGQSPPEQLDGAFAADVFLRDYDFPEAAPDELVAAYLDALKAVEAWKEQKPGLDDATYYGELERLLLSAARTNQRIRSYEDGAATEEADTAGGTARIGSAEIGPAEEAAP